MTRLADILRAADELTNEKLVYDTVAMHDLSALSGYTLVEYAREQRFHGLRVVVDTSIRPGVIELRQRQRVVETLFLAQ